ncbi:MAG: putative tricarboxylic transport rane protein [Candidatus Petromonas sp.]|jgi:putative tricarboxylic transport membrane protein|nr:putative tricarboxylic transport rane protein [Candidatus Petromonas sp.]
MNLSALAGIFAFVIGAIYTIQAFMLPNASIGNPMAPKVLPIGLGILMTFFGLILTFQEVRKNGLKSKDKTDQKEKDDNVKKIVFTCGAAIIYALLFNRIGYILSTIVFLEIVLTLFNGKKKWKTNTAVSICFSVFIYIVFSKFLGVILPKIPFIYI